MAVSAKEVKELRDRTGLGFADCKAALAEADGDMDAAIRILKEKGAIKAAKKGDREAKEGIIGMSVAEDGKKAAMIKVHCETDFVAKNEDFQAYADRLAEHLVKSSAAPASAEDMMKEDLTNGEGTVEALLNAAIQKLGENMTLGEFVVFEADYVGQYLHFNRKVGILIKVKAETVTDDVKSTIKEVGMHIASDSPAAVRSDEIDPELAKEQREIFEKNTRESGKPENMIDKIVDGRMNKWYKEVCLLEQPYFTGDKGTIKEMLKELSDKVGSEVDIETFKRLQIGG